MNNRCAVLIVTHTKVSEVLDIIDALRKNPTKSKFELYFYVGISSAQHHQEHEMQFRRYEDVKVSLLDEECFWAKSFQLVFDQIAVSDYEYFMHINDDVIPQQLHHVKLSEILMGDVVGFANILDRNGNQVFGKKVITPLKALGLPPKLEVFNGNFFSCKISQIVKVMPKYKFNHAFLDYVLSHHLLTNGSKQIAIPMRTVDEDVTSRASTFETIVNYRNSRLNPLDTFMMYFYLRHPLSGFFLSVYCLWKIIMLEIKQRIYLNGK